MRTVLETDHYKLVDARHGRFLANPKDIYLGRSMIAYGEFSEFEWMLLDQLVSTDDVVIEVGANMGSFTVPLARKVGAGGLVFAFEPQLIVFQQLCANFALNDLVNVQAFNAACAEEPGWLAIARFNPTKDRNFGGLNLDMLRGKGATRVRIERLDDVVDPPRLTLIKVDVEGMEASVLRGARRLIDTHRPWLYVEAHDDVKSPELFRLLNELNYDCWWHLPPMYNPQNHALNFDNLFGGITSKNVICAPMEKEATIKGARKVAGPDDHPRRWS